jgi:microcystin-dependent protein
MINEKYYTRAGFLALSLGMAVLGYRQMGAHADGIPGMNPMTYAGTLEETSGPVTGTRNLRLTIWDDATSTESSRARCITSAPGTMVTNGRFQVVLDNACTAAVRGNPDLFLEVEVNGGSLGRTKISAVPFAVEAGRAASLTAAASNTLVPSGSIVAFGGPTAPDGWLLCDGRAVSRSTYGNLFTAIGTSHGGGDGAATFNLPDMRGRFLRGADLGAGRDPDRAARTAAAAGGNIGDTVGTLETDAYRSHTHGVTDPGHSHVQATNAGAGAYSELGTTSAGADYIPATRTSAEVTGVTIQAAGSGETRPVNIAVNYIIKF